MKGIGKIFLVIFGTLGVFVLFIAASKYLLDQRLESILGALPPEQRAPLESALKTQNEETQEKLFRSPEGNLELSYSSDWIEVPPSTQPTSEDKYSSKVLLRAAKFTLQGNSAQFIITELTASNETIERILKDMEESNLEQGWNMKILDSTVEETKGVFQIEYSKEGETAMRSKEKIIMGSQKAYIIAVLSNEAHWEEFAKEADSILSSAQLVL